MWIIPEVLLFEKIAETVCSYSIPFNSSQITITQDYKRHSALNNVLEADDYGIQEAYIFSEGNVEVDGKKVYMPIYMIMFMDNLQLDNPIYRLDLSGLGE